MGVVRSSGMVAPRAMPQQVPMAYTGGEAVPGAISSLSNLRTIIQNIWTRPLALGATTPIEVPNVGYSKAYRYIPYRV
jgi:hypothetical protein